MSLTCQHNKWSILKAINDHYHSLKLEKEFQSIEIMEFFTPNVRICVIKCHAWDFWVLWKIMRSIYSLLLSNSRTNQIEKSNEIEVKRIKKKKCNTMILRIFEKNCRFILCKLFSLSLAKYLSLKFKLWACIQNNKFANN